jgi:hypothetical protein
MTQQTIAQVNIEKGIVHINRPKNRMNLNWVLYLSGFMVFFCLILRDFSSVITAVLLFIFFYELVYHTPLSVEIDDTKITITYPDAPINFKKSLVQEIKIEDVVRINADLYQKKAILFMQLTSGKEYCLSSFESFWQLEKVRTHLKTTPWLRTLEHSYDIDLKYRFFRYP